MWVRSTTSRLGSYASFFLFFFFFFSFSIFFLIFYLLIHALDRTLLAHFWVSADLVTFPFLFNFGLMPFSCGNGVATWNWFFISTVHGEKNFATWAMMHCDATMTRRDDDDDENGFRIICGYVL